ncbi:MAG TPA: PIN domain-containing protein [Candidatus Nanoarchaeia archaeon]|nr:PIN domain-containing protein [Candidatus Nanoarchaeia archaeon]
MKYIIDAYAWIEYFEGSLAGKKIQEIIANNDVLTLSITVAEVISKVKRKGLNEQIAYHAITSNSRVIDISPESARDAGLIHAEVRKKTPNFGLVDSVLLAVAREQKLKIVTGDHHFALFKEVLLIR